MHSWIEGIHNNGSIGSDSGNGDFDERISDIIADTVGGHSRRRRANSILQQSSNRGNSQSQQQQQHLESQRQTVQTTPQQAHESSNRLETLEPVRDQVRQHGRQNSHLRQQNSNQELGQRQPFSPIIDLVNTEKAENGWERQQNHHSNRAASVASMPSSILSEDEFERHHRQKIQSHPKPGKAAQKLYRLVNLPFRAQFGSESRVQSSHELEQHRAGSSLKPAFTPMLKESEPEIILRDSPRGFQTHTPRTIQSDQHKLTNQQEGGAQPHTTIIPHSTYLSPSEQRRRTTKSTQTQQQQQFFPPSQQNRISPSQLPTPSPPIQRPHSSQFQNWRPKTRSLSISDYPPLYDFVHRPHVPPPINVDSWALGPGHYRRLYLENMVKRIREHEQRNSKLRAQLSRFDKQSKQELDELELLYREHELEIRRRQHEERMREQEELERATTARPSPPLLRNGRQPATALQSILKKPPPPPSSSGRVAFSSPPIRSVNLYTPNQSGADSSKADGGADEQNRNDNIRGGPSVSSRIFPPKNPPQRHCLTLSNRANQSGGYRSTTPSAANVQTERERSFRRADAWTI